MNLIFLGPPGAGKGTIAHRVMDDLKLVQISTGDLLRAAVKAGTELGRKAKTYMDAGDLVPDALVIGMLKERVAQPDCASGFILDGFPRTIPQAKALDAAGLRIDKVINFIVDDELIVHRLAGRRVHRETGKIYNVNPDGVPQPPPEIVHQLFQRDDDKPEAIRNRLVVYRQQTQPLIAFYQDKKLLADIQADADIDDIVASVKAAV